MTSHDLEDILIVVDGREELLSEVKTIDADVRHFIAEQIRELQEHYDFDALIEGSILGPDGRADLVRDRLSALAAH